MKSRVFILLAGSFGYTGVQAQLDYSRFYEHYKSFEQNKTVTLYLTGSHIYGRYNNVNMLLLAANLPQIDPNAQAIGCGGMISQDRLIAGTDVVVFHNIFNAGNYLQTGAFNYLFAGYKFFDGKKFEASILTGFGVGFMNVFPKLVVGTNGSDHTTGATSSYTLYNIRPLRAGIFLYNVALSYSYRLNQRFSLGLLAGLDCMPASAWNMANSSEFSGITKLQEGNVKGYVSITTGICIDR